MKLSTRGRYGVRLMLDLALHYGQGPVFLKDIAARQDISKKYLWQLLAPLMKAGWVVSTRGVRGGYALAHLPERIVLKDIVLLLEGPLNLVKCVDDTKACRLSRTCIARDIWSQISQDLMKSLAGVTLKDMVKKQLRKRSKKGLRKYAV